MASAENQVLPESIEPLSNTTARGGGVVLWVLGFWGGVGTYNPSLTKQGRLDIKITNVTIDAIPTRFVAHGESGGFGVWLGGDWNVAALNSVKTYYAEPNPANGRRR